MLRTSKFPSFIILIAFALSANLVRADPETENTISGSEAAPPSGSHVDCLNRLLRGFKRAERLNLDFLYLARTGELPYSADDTCQFAELQLGAVAREFDEAGCQWGNFPSGVFRARLLSVFDGATECQIGAPASLNPEAWNWPSILCTPEDEIFAALRHIIFCGHAAMRSNSPRTNPCLATKKVFSCFDGLVDSCHDDNGESSSAILDALASILGTFLTHPGGSPSDPVRSMVRQQLDTCPEEDLGQLLGRLTMLDLEWTKEEEEDQEGEGMDLGELKMLLLNGTTPMRKDNEYSRRLWHRFFSIMEEVRREDEEEYS